MDKLLVALDVDTGERALKLASALNGVAGGFKVGSRLFTLEGPALVRSLCEHGARVFLDLKFHDIPNTVEQACAAATRLGVWMLNVHACGGAAMLAAAREGVDRAAREATRPAPLLIGVTVLTSLSNDDLAAIGVADPAERQVMRLAKLAQSSGLAGVVCSPQEAAMLRAACGPEFILVTPGIRLADATVDDQTRIATPESAIREGADYLVIGRPIIRAPDPRAALAAIRASIGERA